MAVNTKVGKVCQVSKCKARNEMLPRNATC